MPYSVADTSSRPLDFPPACFCYTVGVSVTFSGGEGHLEVENQKQTAPISFVVQTVSILKGEAEKSCRSGGSC